jgi:hypothetical protein
MRLQQSIGNLHRERVSHDEITCIRLMLYRPEQYIDLLFRRIGSGCVIGGLQQKTVSTRSLRMKIARWTSRDHILQTSHYDPYNNKEFFAVVEPLAMAELAHFNETRTASVYVDNAVLLYVLEMTTRALNDTPVKLSTTMKWKHLVVNGTNMTFFGQMKYSSILGGFIGPKHTEEVVSTTCLTLPLNILLQEIVDTPCKEWRHGDV